jgi:hypothetical protein
MAHLTSLDTVQLCQYSHAFLLFGPGAGETCTTTNRVISPFATQAKLITKVALRPFKQKENRMPSHNSI